MYGRGSFKHFNVLQKKSYKMSFQGLLMRMHGNVKNLSSALDSVQRSKSEVHRSVVAYLY